MDVVRKVNSVLCELGLKSVSPPPSTLPGLPHPDPAIIITAIYIHAWKANKCLLKYKHAALAAHQCPGVRALCKPCTVTKGTDHKYRRAVQLSVTVTDPKKTPKKPSDYKTSETAENAIIRSGDSSFLSHPHIRRDE